MYYMDYHLHSRYSFDSAADMDAICRQALSLGLSEIAFTDHLDLHLKMSGCFYLEHEKEREAAYREVQEKYRRRLAVRYGLELGQPDWNPAFLNDFNAARSFDFILGSVHYTTDEREILEIAYQSKAQADGVLREYFQNVRRMLEGDGYDAVAHLCHPLRAMERVWQKPTLLMYGYEIRPILRRAAERGKALEVSTKGLRYWIHALEPEMEILEWYRELGGEYVTVGTDSHEADTVGSGIREAYDYIRQAGFRYVTRYEARRPVLVPL